MNLVILEDLFMSLEVRKLKIRTTEMPLKSGLSIKASHSRLWCLQNLTIIHMTFFVNDFHFYKRCTFFFLQMSLNFCFQILFQAQDLDVMKVIDLGLLKVGSHFSRPV
jgi:hypothetical protein